MMIDPCDQRVLRAIEFEQERARRRIAELGADLARAMDACAGVVGLIQLIASRNDLPPGLDDLMRLNHRMTEARAFLAEREREGK